MGAIRLFLAGDVMTGRGIDQILPHPCDPDLYEPHMRSAEGYVSLAERRSGPIPRAVDPAYLWGDALGALERVDSDLRIVNLETAVTDRGDPWPGKGIHYRMHPANIGALTAAGIDCAVLANNHVLDWSVEGLVDTLEALHRAGIASVGAGLDRTSAHSPMALAPGVVVVGVGTRSSGIPGAWAAGTSRPGVALVRLTEEEAEAIARRARSMAAGGEVVVVSIHWGGNWGHEVPPEHRRFARALIDRGAHVVHGHSSHHPMAIEVYRGRPILYGCGDLINDYEGIGGREEFRGELGLLYFLTLEDGAVAGLELVVVRRERFRLVRARDEEAGWMADLLQTVSRLRVDHVGEGRLVVGW